MGYARPYLPNGRSDDQNSFEISDLRGTFALNMGLSFPLSGLLCPASPRQGLSHLGPWSEARDPFRVALPGLTFCVCTRSNQFQKSMLRNARIHQFTLWSFRLETDLGYLFFELRVCEGVGTDEWAVLCLPSVGSIMSILTSLRP